MESNDFRILGLSGSLRRTSTNRGLLRAARELAPEGVSVEIYEELEKLPFFDQDIEEEGDPALVQELKEKIQGSDAVLLATPEYDYAVPGVLVNALDWAMRPPSPLKYKPVGIVGASPGGVGTARGQMVLRQILLHAPAYVMPEPQVLIPRSRDKFDASGDLVDEETQDRLRRFLEALVEWTERLAQPAPTQSRNA